MANLKLLKEPGYVFDLMLLFFLHFNGDCMDNFINKNKEQEDKEHFESILKSFYPISEDLYVFFHAGENKNCFMTLNYFYMNKDKFISAYNADTIQKELSDYVDVTERVFEFYFPKLSKSQVKNFLEDEKLLFRMIKDSKYTEKEKNRLYEFFMDPVPYIQKLQYELLEKEVRLSSYYEKQYEKILDVYSQITLDSLRNQAARVDNYLTEESLPLYLSFCFVNKNCINFITLDEGSIYILGYDYTSIIEYLDQREQIFKIDEFGLVLSDENRVKMLDLIQSKGETTRRTIEMESGLSSSIIYHNLAMMTRCGMLKTRNQGKRIYYSVNNSYFEQVLSRIKKYSNK